MWGNVVDRFSSLFERQFFIAYWFPVAVGAGLFAGMSILINGFWSTVSWTRNISEVMQVLLALGLLLGITALASPTGYATSVPQSNLSTVRDIHQ